MNKVEVKQGINWFYWVAGLSIVNTLLYFLNAGVVFPVGLGVGQLLTYFLSSSGLAVGIVLGVIYILSVGLFLLSGFLANKGMRIFLIIGTIAYVIDTLIILGLTIVSGQTALLVDLGFHIFVLFYLIRASIITFRS